MTNLIPETFYPTPATLVFQMIEAAFGKFPINLEGKTILDPSAGKGHILDHCKEYRGKTLAVEIDGDFQTILRKKHKVVGSDWLTFTGRHAVDAILMNPPFNRGIDHLMKAIQWLPNGKIVCLLNNADVKNQDTTKRQLLAQVIKDRGYSKCLGSPFSAALRQTDVEVAMVVIENKSESLNFDFSGMKTAGGPEMNFAATDEGMELSNANYLESVVRSFDKSTMAAYKLAQAIHEFQLYANPFFTDVSYGNSRLKSMIKDALDNARGADNDFYKDFYNMLVSDTRSRAWGFVFEKTKLRDYMTKGLLDGFDAFQKEQSDFEFSVENISSLLSMMVENRGEIIDKALEDVFDMFCRYGDKNKVHIEGWKTNSAYKVNRTVILPFANYGYSGLELRYGYGWDGRQLLGDVDKVLCYLSGKKFDEISTIVEALQDQFKRIYKCESKDYKAESEFFSMTFYKKGTIHMTFKDETLWRQFNMRAAEIKGWSLPETVHTYERNKF